MTIRQNLITFIQEKVIGESEEIKIDENELLIDQGFIDSVGLMKIITFIEKQNGIQIPAKEVLPDNFQTVKSMERMIQRLQDSM
jgi:acyl carrier protein